MKFVCSCGNVIRDQTTPNAIGFRVISDNVIEEIAEKDNLDFRKFLSKSSRALVCNVCSRFYIMWKKDGVLHSMKFEAYFPEFEDKQDIVTSLKE